MKEKWKEIKDWPGYFVSSNGRIKSTKRHRGKGERLLFTRVSNFGYVRTALFKNGKQKAFSVHRLVAIAFIPNPSNKPQVNHKNGIKTDNRVENLEWVTASENQKHAFALGISSPPIGERQGNSRLTKKDVLNIRSEYKCGGTTQREIGEKYGIDPSHVSDIVNNKRWTHV